MSTKMKLARASLAVAFAAGAISIVAAAPAGAAPLNSCKKLSGSATFSPGLSPVAKNQTIKTKGTASGCTPAKSTGGSGAVLATIKSPNASCTSLLQGGQTLKGTAQTTWKNKKISKFTLSLKTGTGSNATTATISGKVTSGLFKGKSVSGQVKFTPKAGQNCATVPVTNVTFVSTKPFVVK